jgi:hypothetical protein
MFAPIWRKTSDLTQIFYPNAPGVAEIAHLSMLHRIPNVALCDAICEDLFVCGSALLLLRHRRLIPPFSSYGGILKARSKPPRLFLPVVRIALRHPRAGRRIERMPAEAD